MKRFALAFVVLLALAGCLSDGGGEMTETTLTVEPGDHEAVEVAVSEDVSEPHLCYTADGDGAFDVLVFGFADEYQAYQDGEAAQPIAALSSVNADKDVEPDVDLGTFVEPRTHYVVVDNTDFEQIEGLEGGSPSPAGEEAVTVDVAYSVREGGC